MSFRESQSICMRPFLFRCIYELEHLFASCQRVYHAH